MPETISLIDDAFYGLDATTAPERLSEGFLTVADNVVLDGGAGGYIKTRPGKQGQLTSATGRNHGEGIVYRRANGTQTFLHVEGGTTGAQLYTWDKGATTVTAVSGSNVFDRAKVQMARHGDYVFIVGGDASNAGKVWRWNPDAVSPYSIFEEATGLTTPTRTLAASLAFSEITNAVSGSWEQDSVSGSPASISITNGTFVGGSTSPESSPDPLDPSGSGGSDEWLVQSGQVETELGSHTDPQTGRQVDPFNTTRKYARMDDPGSAIKSASFYTITSKTNSLDTSATRKAMHLLIGIRYNASRGTDTILCTAELFPAASSTAIASQTVVFSNEVAGTPVDLYRIISFGNQDDTNGTRVKLTFTAGAGNIPAAGTSWGPFFSDIRLWAIDIGLAPTDDGDYQRFTLSALDSATIPTVGDTLPIGSDRFAYDVPGTSADFSQTQFVVLPVRFYREFSSFRLRLGLKEGGAGGTVNWSEEGELFTTESGTRYFRFFVGDIATADRNAVTHSVLHFLDDPVYESGTLATGDQFAFGPFASPGELTIGRASYEWVYREKRGGVTSKVSTVSTPSVTPDGLTAIGSFVVSGSLPENADLDGSNETTIEVYRRGGGISDGLFYLVAEFDPDADASGDGWAWTQSTRTFRDNVPDATLLIDNSVLFDHDYYPFGGSNPAYAVSVFSGRLAVGTASEVYLSQIAGGRGVGLYWDTSAIDPTDPNLPERGYRRRASGNDSTSSGDTIQRLVPFLTRLVILFQSGIYQLSGIDPSDFALRRFEADEGKGCIAPKGIVVFDGALWFLASDGLRRFNGAIITRESGRLEKLLNPSGAWAGSNLNASAYASSWLTHHAGRLFLGVPTASSGSAIGAVYVWDIRGGGTWVRWLLGDATFGFSFTSDADTDDFYVSDSGGMFYSINGGTYGDKATAGGATTGVTLSIESRSITGGQHGVMAQRFFADVECADTTATLTWQVTGDSVTTQRDSRLFRIGAGETRLDRLKIGSHVRGRRMRYGISATTTEPLIIKRVEVAASLGRDR